MFKHRGGGPQTPGQKWHNICVTDIVCHRVAGKFWCAPCIVSNACTTEINKNTILFAEPVPMYDDRFGSPFAIESVRQDRKNTKISDLIRFLGRAG